MSDSESVSSDSDSVQVSFPPKLVARLFAEHFTHAESRVSAAAVETAAEYLRIFTREAVWRTEGALREESNVSGSRTRVLEAVDLEKVAGTLVLDF
ncbi:centromere protein X [Kockiozyma suomiensis]|uniref:centromere protein X n=1 Tax=Kockiozyma suomiensis TaxID=1337062 RepID=UPI003343DB0F